MGAGGANLSCIGRQGTRTVANTSDNVVANSYFNSLAGYKGSQYFFKAFTIVDSGGHRYLKLAQMTNGGNL